MYIYIYVHKGLAVPTPGTILTTYVCLYTYRYTLPDASLFNRTDSVIIIHSAQTQAKTQKYSIEKRTYRLSRRGVLSQQNLDTFRNAFARNVYVVPAFKCQDQFPGRRNVHHGLGHARKDAWREVESTEGVPCMYACLILGKVLFVCM
jgi:hypothetical protein